LRACTPRPAACDYPQNRDRRPEPAAAEQRAEARADLAHDGKSPGVAARVVFESVEGERVHHVLPGRAGCYARARITRPVSAPVCSPCSMNISPATIVWS